MPIKLLGTAIAAALIVANALLRWVSSGLGIVAVMASAAIVISCVSLIMSGNNGRRINELNKRPGE